MPLVMCGPERSTRLGAGVGGGRRMKVSWLASRCILAFRLVYFRCFRNPDYVVMSKTHLVIIKPFGVNFLLLIMLYLWTRLCVSFNAYMSILVAI
jgi:hypothetical protein